MTMVFLLLLLLTGLIGWRLWTGGESDQVSLPQTLPLFNGLALMVDGAFLVIKHPETDRFVQFCKAEGDGSYAKLIFDLPAVGANVVVFPQAVEQLGALGFEVRKVIETGMAPGSPVVTAQIVVEGSPAYTAERAFLLAEKALSGLSAQGDRYLVTFVGQRDVNARARAAEDSLAALGQMRIPMLSRFARRTLRDLAQTQRNRDV